MEVAKAMTDTMSRTDAASATVPQHPDITDPTHLDDQTIAEINKALKPAKIKPSFTHVVETIVAECEAANVPCSVRQARQVIGFFSNLNGQRRKDGWTGISDHLTNRQIRDFHAQLDVVIPDDTVSELGSESAHRQIELYVLGSEADELGLGHTRAKVGRVTYCAVLVAVVSRG